jgi:hypothetical protein
MRGQENFAKPPLSAQRARSASAIARSRKCGQTGEILGLICFAELTTPALRATPPFQGGENDLLGTKSVVKLGFRQSEVPCPIE